MLEVSLGRRLRGGGRERWHERISDEAKKYRKYGGSLKWMNRQVGNVMTYKIGIPLSLYRG